MRRLLPTVRSFLIQSGQATSLAAVAVGRNIPYVKDVI